MYQERGKGLDYLHARCSQAHVSMLVVASITEPMSLRNAITEGEERQRVIERDREIETMPIQNPGISVMSLSPFLCKHFSFPVCIYIYVKLVYMYVFMNVCMYVCSCVCIYTYIHRLSGTSGLASNPANREIASSSGASVHQDILFFRFFSIFF
jgi:hypothetical protein